jgi:lipopolysaccharide export system protein LptA
MRRALALGLALLASAAAAAPAEAQNLCRLVYQTGPWTSSGAEGQRVIHASGPLQITCAAGEELRADSAVIYEPINEVHLFRRVDYQDPGRALTSDYATYNGGTGRLWATGNVVFTDRGRGSTLRGPNLEYFRPVEGRPEAQAIATERPHLTVAPSGERRRDPMEVDADRITTVGERYVTAEGNVVIQGDGMDAWGAQAFYDATEERLELRRDARAKAERFDLTADFIQTELDEGALQEVLARGDARLVEERMRVTGPQIRLFFERDSLQRLVSGHGPSASEGGAGRSVALARGFRMEADSLEALTPGQRVRRVTAIGTARGEAWDTAQVAGPLPTDAAGPDTVAGLALGERDLILGDTIVGFFRDDAPLAAATDTAAADTTAGDTAAAPPAEPAAPVAAGSAEEAELERVVATGNARSLYRMTPSREERPEPGARRGINYVIGDTIDLTFAAGEVELATVRGLKRGVYLDPVQTAAAEPADAVPADAAPAEPGAPVEPEPAPATPPPAPAPDVPPPPPAPDTGRRR